VACTPGSGSSKSPSSSSSSSGASALVELVELLVVDALALGVDALGRFALLLASLVDLAPARRVRLHDALAARPRCELAQLAEAEHGACAQRSAALGDATDDLEAERIDEPPELGEIGLVLDVVDTGELDGHQDCTRSGLAFVDHAERRAV
jgi:hypothetical protein